MAEAHLDAYLQLGDLARVVAIVSSDSERGRSLAARVPNARCVTRFADAVNDPEIVGIDICGHTLAHAPSAIAALEADKHVLIEKPPALTLDTFDAIADAAKSAGRVAMVGQTVRFQPVVSTIIESVDAGEVGKVSMVHVSWYVAHVWPHAWRGWQLDPERSGGHLIHNGMHSIDLALRLLDDQPATVFARGWKTYSPDLPTPDSFHIVMQCLKGGIAVLETTYGLRPPAEPVRRIVAAGETGTLSHSTIGETELHNPTVSTEPPSTRGAMLGEIRAWLLAIRGDAPSPIRLTESRHALAAAIAAHQSYESGQAVLLPARGEDGGRDAR
jgi:predicted dehydrogenase